MKPPWAKRPKSDTAFHPPLARAHRGFAYLDDDIVINSLSALESGKVDEVVEKINLAQERGLSVGAKVGADSAGLTAGASTKGTESLQAEVIRRRTRFSIFELWYEALARRKAIGRFNRWGGDALAGVEVGHVVEIRGRIEIVPIQTGLRMFLWYVNEVREGNALFTSGTDLPALEASEHIVKFMIGKRDELNATLTPFGETGPKVGITFLNEWIIESVGRWNGVYTLVAQVEEVLDEGESWQTMRIIEDAPLTPLEETTLNDAIAPFGDALTAFGIELDETPTKLMGPAIVLRPIALFR